MALIIDIKVVPSSSRQTVTIDKQGHIKIYLNAPPERGLANKELIQLLAKKLRIAQHTITIIAGTTGRKKRIKIDAPLTEQQLFAALEIEKQRTLF